MKILIVDDEPQRYGRLVETLQSVGIGKSEIDTAVSTRQADEFLQHTHFDLLILDIVLPLWPQGPGDPQNALDLLFAIHQEDGLKRPRHIVGLTADRGAAEQAAAEFTALTWTIIEYSPTNDDWVNRLVACVRYLKGVTGQAYAVPADRADVVVVCALAAPELANVLKLPWGWRSQPTMLPDATFVHQGQFTAATGKTYTVAAAHAPRMGMVSSALLSASLIEHLRPRLIVMTGICAGLRNKVGLGDVLLADPSWDFQSGKRFKQGTDGDFVARAHQLPAPTVVRRLLQEIDRQRTDLEQMARAYDGDRPEGDLRVIAGPVACGSAVLADGEVIEEIKKRQHGEVIGVEMEIYGVYAAAAGAAEPQPMAFALKGVCDFADPDKVDDAQDFAAYMSANVLQLLLERHGTVFMP